QDGFRAGVNGGIPVGDFDDFLSFSLSVDLSYGWEVSDGIDLGLISGVNFNFGKDEFDDVKYAPVAGMARFSVGDGFAIGGDVGIAFNLESNGGSDFYWRPVVAYSISDMTDIQASYSNVSGDGASLSSINVGVGFRF
ncbi:MAG: hypothetical protein HKO96_08835, partial [Flavobacteriaceae bacterium]|nr:hypothetical protein [Flavobacteriaceae bacterium]